MKKKIMIFITGTVIYLMTVPFLFAQVGHGYDPFRTHSNGMQVNFIRQIKQEAANPQDSLTPVKIDSVKPTVNTEKKFKMKILKD